MQNNFNYTEQNIRTYILMVLILCSNKRVAIKLNNLMKEFFFPNRFKVFQPSFTLPSNQHITQNFETTFLMKGNQN